MRRGAKVILATKLRLGDSNSVMAQGGMQISVAPEDSPVTHFVDTLKGGHMQNDHQLLKVMVEEGPSIAKWLLSLGVLFDRDGGRQSPCQERRREFEASPPDLFGLYRP